jgi:hypothetical protein
VRVTVLRGHQQGWFPAVGRMLSIAVGYSPEYLLREVATGRENYYTGAVTDGEPAGRWWGAGAEKLGLRGLVDDDRKPRRRGLRNDDLDRSFPGQVNGLCESVAHHSSSIQSL